MASKVALSSTEIFRGTVHGLFMYLCPLSDMLSSPRFIQFSCVQYSSTVL